MQSSYNKQVPLFSHYRQPGIISAQVWQLKLTLLRKKSKSIDKQ